MNQGTWVEFETVMDSGAAQSVAPSKGVSKESRRLSQKDNVEDKLTPQQLERKLRMKEKHA